MECLLPGGISLKRSIKCRMRRLYRFVKGVKAQAHRANTQGTLRDCESNWEVAECPLDMNKLKYGINFTPKLAHSV